MANLEDVKTRVRQILDDAAGTRFTDTLLENAARQALTRLDEALPLMRSLDVTRTDSGRDQALTGLTGPLFLVKVIKIPDLPESRETEIRYGFTCSLAGDSAALHFSGPVIPRAGESLRVSYASRNTLAGLDGAEATTVPETALTALHYAYASAACLLRAASVSEAYGARPGESARLVEQSKVWMETAERDLQNMKNQQEFAYPAGFALDRWDREAG